MHRYAIVYKKDEISKDLAEKLKVELNMCLEYDEENPELVVTVGGDGTMLYSVHRYQHLIDTVCFIGIHTGTLGFLTDYQKDEYMDLVEDMKKGEYGIFQRNLLDIQTNKGSFLALNECRIENNMRSQVLDVFINDKYFETFRGNGLCVSTSSGSTAYNKSLGGAVACTSSNIMQLSEIAGIHHNAYRSLGSPLILDKSFTFRFESQNFENAVLGIDHLVFDLKDVEYIQIGISEHCARFVQFKRVTFMERLKRAFLNV